MESMFLDFSIILITLILASAIYVFYSIFNGKYDLSGNSKDVFAVVDVIRMLKKICPVGTANEWQLLPLNCGIHRCWKKQVLDTPMKNSISLCGSSVVFDCSIMYLVPFIADVSKWKEWDPLYCSKTLHVKSFQCQNMSKDRYMRADEVLETENWGQSSVMYRFQCTTWEKTGWILFWNVEKLEFMFFLIQSAIYKNEDVCLVTHIVGSKEFQNSSATVVLERMRNIKDMISLSQVNILKDILPSNLSKTIINDASSNSLKKHQKGDQEVISEAVPESGFNDNNSYRIFMLVPILSHSKFETLKGFQLMTKNIQPKSSNRHKIKERASKYDKPKSNLRRAVSDLVMKPKSYSADLNRNSLLNLNPNDNKIGLNEELTKFDDHEKHITTYSEDSKLEEILNKTDDKKHITSLGHKELRSFSESALSNIDDYKILTSLDNLQAQLDNHKSDADRFNVFNESIEEEDSSVMDEENQNDPYCSTVLGFEILDYNRGFSNCKIVDFVTQGNYGASELQAEVLLASEMYGSEGAVLNANGWFHHSTHKGIPVLSKTTSSQCMKISSFMCQIILPVQPKNVWKFVKNPRFRFLCDKTVKSVDIMAKISDSQKLIHTYHVTSGIIWKEFVDFCLLQTEREELNRYYSAFHSIEYEQCPFMNRVTRAILMPSGWVVEEDEKDPKSSKVTYLIQALNTNSDSLFIQELSTLVPESLLNLKNYTLFR